MMTCLMHSRSPFGDWKVKGELVIGTTSQILYIITSLVLTSQVSVGARRVLDVIFQFSSPAPLKY